MPAADTAKNTVNTAADATKNTVDTAAANTKAAFQTTQTAAVEGAKAWQGGMEKATAASGVAFKDAAEKSLGALNEMSAQGKRNLEAVVASVTAATKGAEELASQAMAYTKTSMQTQAEAARSITAARSVQEVLELQTNYAKTAMEAYMAQMTRASETVTVAVKDAMQPLNARATAMMESVQAAR